MDEQPILEPIAVEPLNEPAPVEAAASAVTISALMTKDEFFAFFAGCFSAAGGVAGMMIPPGEPLQSLMQAGELPTARPAADAIFALAEKMPWLQFLIRKDGAWMAQIAVIGAFGFQLTAALRAELAARLAPPPADSEATA